MIFRRLSVRLGLNLVFLLALGMGLVNLVMALALQRGLVLRETGRAERMAEVLARRDSGGDLSQEVRLLGAMEPAAAVTVFRPDRSAAMGAAPDGVLAVALRSAAAEAERRGAATRRTAGNAWGVFWKRPAFALAACPLTAGGSIAVSLDLRPLYANLRQAEGVALGYLIINLFLLALLGVYRLHRLTVHPLHRLLQRAETFREDEEVFFQGEGDEGEFTQLSRSLNRMLYRISEGKKALRSTVRSLETANRELRQARQDVINAEKLASVGRLSAGIAHEIGNPVAIVIGYLELLRQPGLDEDQRMEFVRRTEAEVHRINQIIRQLLDLARPAPERAEAVSLHALIRDTAAVVSCQPLMADIQIEMDLAAERDLVMADPGQIRQVFLNLMLNAADALGDVPEGRIELKSRNRFGARSEIEIRVADNGAGIPESQLPNIFDPFFTTKEPGKGTGLGLSVTFMIVQAAGGTIDAFSLEGEGARIVIRLPLHTGDN
ncbi:MAG: sensor histidine kinase [Desulfococcaceae bacterium]